MNVRASGKCAKKSAVDRTASNNGGNAMKRLLAVAVLAVAATAAQFASAQGSVADVTDMQALRDAVKADKKAFVASKLALTPAEAKKFWPLYDQYQRALTLVGQQRAVSLEGQLSRNEPMSNLIRRGCIAMRGDEAPRGDDDLARLVAVEADAHETSGAQQGAQRSPSGERIGEVMEHPGGRDNVEAAADRAKPEDIGLRVLEIAQPELARLALGIGEAGKAQIDGQYSGPWKLARSLDRLLASPASCDQDVEVAAIVDRGQCRSREQPAQMRSNARLGVGGRRLDPARVRMLLVLLPHPLRDRVVDCRQPWQGRAQALLLERLSDLLGEECGNGGGPRSGEQGLDAGECCEREIRSDE